MIIIGIDPSTGSRSAVGFAVVDMTQPDKPVILKAVEFQIPKTVDLRPRLKHIAALVAKEFKELEAKDADYLITIESTVMQGKGGQSLQRAIGAILTISPSARRFEEVYPMSVKKHVTGIGKSGDKKAIAEGLKRIFSDKQSLELIFNLTASSRWDTLDSIAIALTGYELHAKGPKKLSNTKPSKTKQKIAP